MSNPIVHAGGGVQHSIAASSAPPPASSTMQQSQQQGLIFKGNNGKPGKKGDMQLPSAYLEHTKEVGGCPLRMRGSKRLWQCTRPQAVP